MPNANTWQSSIMCQPELVPYLDPPHDPVTYPSSHEARQEYTLDRSQMTVSAVAAGWLKHTHCGFLMELNKESTSTYCP